VGGGTFVMIMSGQRLSRCWSSVRGRMLNHLTKSLAFILQKIIISVRLDVVIFFCVLVHIKG